MTFINYQQRLSRITQASDIDAQIKQADSYAKTLRTKSKSSCLTLAEKVEMGRKAKEAEAVAHQLKLNYFQIEDALVRGCSQDLS